MHQSSMLKVKAFLEVHAAKTEIDQPLTVLDIGSASYGKPAHSYRSLTDAAGLIYTGLDMQEGNNVDIVPKNPIIYDEIERETFDLVISGQAFEHNPFFWATFCEVARVLKQGGHVMIIAPSAGAVHRFPFDCWRFYPDSWVALCALSGLELNEVIYDPDLKLTQVRGSQWGDSAVVATKPRFSSAEEEKLFYMRLELLTWPYRHMGNPVVAPEKMNAGAVVSAYGELAAKIPGAPAAPAASPAAPQSPAKNPAVQQVAAQNVAVRQAAAKKAAAMKAAANGAAAARSAGEDDAVPAE